MSAHSCARRAARARTRARTRTDALSDPPPLAHALVPRRYSVLAWDHGGNAVLALGALAGVVILFFAAALLTQSLDRCVKRRVAAAEGKSVDTPVAGTVAAAEPAAGGWFCTPSDFVDSPVATAWSCTQACEHSRRQRAVLTSVPLAPASSANSDAAPP